MSVIVGPDQRVTVSSTGVVGSVNSIAVTDNWLQVSSEPFSQVTNQTLFPNNLSALIYLVEAEVTFENPSVTTRQDVQALIQAPSPATYILGPCAAFDSINPPPATSGQRSVSTQQLFAVIGIPAGIASAPCQLMARGIGVRHKIARDATGNPLAFLTSSLEGPVTLATVDSPANKTLSLSPQTVFTLTLPTSSAADLYYRVRAAALFEQDYTTAQPPRVLLAVTGQSGQVVAEATMPVPATNVAAVVQRSVTVETVVKVAKVAKGGASSVSCPITAWSTLADGTSKLVGAKQSGNVVTYALATA